MRCGICSLARGGGRVERELRTAREWARGCAGPRGVERQGWACLVLRALDAVDGLHEHLVRKRLARATGLHVVAAQREASLDADLEDRLVPLLPRLHDACVDGAVELLLQLALGVERKRRQQRLDERLEALDRRQCLLVGRSQVRAADRHAAVVVCLLPLPKDAVADEADRFEVDATQPEPLHDGYSEEEVREAHGQRAARSSASSRVARGSSCGRQHRGVLSSLSALGILSGETTEQMSRRNTP